MTPRASERGMALLTVLILVAFISVVASISLERLKLSSRMTGNIAALDQARGYGYVAETIVLSRLAALSGPDVTRTPPDSGLIGVDLPFPVERGRATVRIEDSGNCFNVNSVVQGEAGQPLTARPAGMQQLEALILLNDAQPAAARQIAAATADWIDADNVALPGGAEDAFYIAAKPRYLPANTLMADPSEIRSVAGMTPEIYARIAPWLCALPATILSPVNLNTLRPDQGIVLAMLFNGQVDANDAAQMIDQRPRGGYGNTVDFWKKVTNSGLTPPTAEVQAQTQVKTRWFALDMSAELAGAELRQRGLIDAGGQPAKLVRRVYGDPE
jgi:general secretion pathway protein K